MIPSRYNRPLYQLFQSIVRFAGRRDGQRELGAWSILRSHLFPPSPSPSVRLSIASTTGCQRRATLRPFFGRIPVMCLQDNKKMSQTLGCTKPLRGRAVEFGERIQGPALQLGFFFLPGEESGGYFRDSGGTQPISCPCF